MIAIISVTLARVVHAVARLRWRAARSRIQTKGVWLGFMSIATAVGMAAAEEKRSANWSTELLTQIVREEEAEGTSGPVTPAPGLVLHSYRLSHLRVGEAGRSASLIALLTKLLPPGSAVNADVPANSLHILTTPAAHQAVWDYLSAVDAPEIGQPAPAARVPDEVQAALRKLAESGGHSAQLLASVGALRSDLAAELEAIDARQRALTRNLILAAVATLATGLAGFRWVVRQRRMRPNIMDEAARTPPSDRLATVLAPVQDKMRTEMLGLLNEVAIKLQAQYNEQQRLARDQQRQLDDARLALADERKEFIQQAGTMVVQAVERVDATTAKLAKQQDKVAELVDELQHTVRQLDETKDSLRQKQIELEQERAKIAALSLLLEEGGVLSAPSSATNGHAASADEPSARTNGTVNDSPLTVTLTLPCTTPTLPPPPPPKFTFLPPDLPPS